MTAPAPPAIDNLLESLHRGDEAAAEQIFLAYEPYLTLVVPWQLSGAMPAEFYSPDVVQSVWADLLQRFRQAAYHFPDGDHLRAFLVQATRNRFLDHLRRRLRELKHEQPLSSEESMPASPEADPCEVL